MHDLWGVNQVTNCEGWLLKVYALKTQLKTVDLQPNKWLGKPKRSSCLLRPGTVCWYLSPVCWLLLPKSILFTLCSHFFHVRTISLWQFPRANCKRRGCAYKINLSGKKEEQFGEGFRWPAAMYYFMCFCVYCSHPEGWNFCFLARFFYASKSS